MRWGIIAALVLPYVSYCATKASENSTPSNTAASIASTGRSDQIFIELGQGIAEKFSFYDNLENTVAPFEDILGNTSLMDGNGSPEGTVGLKLFLTDEIHTSLNSLVRKLAVITAAKRSSETINPFAGCDKDLLFQYLKTSILKNWDQLNAPKIISNRLHAPRIFMAATPRKSSAATNEAFDVFSILLVSAPTASTTERLKQTQGSRGIIITNNGAVNLVEVWLLDLIGDENFRNQCHDKGLYAQVLQRGNQIESTHYIAKVLTQPIEKTNQENDRIRNDLAQLTNDTVAKLLNQATLETDMRKYLTESFVHISTAEEKLIGKHVRSFSTRHGPQLIKGIASIFQGSEQPLNELYALHELKERLVKTYGKEGAIWFLSLLKSVNFLVADTTGTKLIQGSAALDSTINISNLIARRQAQKKQKTTVLVTPEWSSKEEHWFSDRLPFYKDSDLGSPQEHATISEDILIEISTNLDHVTLDGWQSSPKTSRYVPSLPAKPKPPPMPPEKIPNFQAVFDGVMSGTIPPNDPRLFDSSNPGYLRAKANYEKIAAERNKVLDSLSNRVTEIARHKLTSVKNYLVMIRSQDKLLSSYTASPERATVYFLPSFALIGIFSDPLNTPNNLISLPN